MISLLRVPVWFIYLSSFGVYSISCLSMSASSCCDEHAASPGEAWSATPQQPQQGGSWSPTDVRLPIFLAEQQVDNAKEHILMFRYSHCAYRSYRAMHYLLVKVPIEDGDGSVTGKVAFCHNGKDGELDQWYSSGFHGCAFVNVCRNIRGDVVLGVDSVIFHYLGINYLDPLNRHTLEFDRGLPNRDREQLAFHGGRKHPNNPKRRIAKGTFWAVVSKCTPENHHDYDRLLHFFLNRPEMLFGRDRSDVSFWV